MVLLESCSRCGVETSTDRLLCPPCTDWLSQRSELDDAAVVDAMQFSRTPVPGESPVQIALAAPAVPLFIELFLAIVITIALLADPVFYGEYAPADQAFSYLYVVSVFLSFGGLVLGAVMARSHPLRAVIISALVCVGLTVIPLGLILALFSTALSEAALVFFVWRCVVIALFAVPLIIALRRHRKIAQARAKLLACNT